MEEINEIKKLAVNGAFYFKRKVIEDDRGFFTEISGKNILEDAQLKFCQTNQSFSHVGVLRGMHFQIGMGKFVTCSYGVLLDVVYDLRKNSSTFGKGFSVELDWSKGDCVYVPAGCAHGFLTLSRFGIITYNCTSFYDKNLEGGVNWQSEEIRGFFPPDIYPKVSPRDELLPTVSEFLEKEESNG